MATKRAAARSGDPIQHVIVLMMENRSLDHFIGDYESVKKINGMPPLNSNSDSTGAVYTQKDSKKPTTKRDLPHELEEVLQQISNNNSGFVLAYEHRWPTVPAADRQEVMDYYPVGSLPAVDVLVRNFLVCDHWHASVPGPTWTNRFFVHSGTSLGRVHMPSSQSIHLHNYDQDTLYDRLNKARISWRIFFGDFPQSLLLTHQRRVRNLRRYGWMSTFYKAAKGKAKNFPQFTFIEPRYFGKDQNDDHPDVDVMKGQKLIADVYNAIRANEELWMSTLLILLYDEHGGFYDHVHPDPAPAPDGHHEEYSFTQFGVRVPAILISPWVANDVLSALFDHTSVLRYLTDKWSLSPPLGLRAKAANSFGGAILSKARTDTPAKITLPAIALARAKRAAPAPKEMLTEYQQALVAFSEVLEQETPEPARVKVARRTRALAGPVQQEEVAIQRVDRFFEKKKAAPALAAPDKPPAAKKRAAKKAPAKKSRRR